VGRWPIVFAKLCACALLAGCGERPFPSAREIAFEDGKSCAIIYAVTHSPRDVADICAGRDHRKDPALRKAYNDGVAAGLADFASAGH
jgi:hypothetical protein